MTVSSNRLQQELGYHFSDEKHLQLALTHRSYAGRNNERLEFLGDSVVNQVVAQALYDRFPTASEGDLSRLRASLVKGVTLAEIALELSLGDYLRLGPGELKSGGFRRASILADAFEALLGAILLDSDYERCRTVILSMFASRLDKLTAHSTKDPKTRLQEYLQSRGEALPMYELESMTGDDHDPTFVVVCTLEKSNTECRGQGSSRRRAEQNAAATALTVLQSESK